MNHKTIHHHFKENYCNIARTGVPIVVRERKIGTNNLISKKETNLTGNHLEKMCTNLDGNQLSHTSSSDSDLNQDTNNCNYF